MTEAYERELQALRREIETGGARPAAIDKHITALMAEGGDDLTRDLLGSLSDRAAYDEGMFSIIHSAESADDIPYVAALLAIFPALSNSSPRWASIVLMRVLNSNQTRHELVRQLRVAPDAVKESIRVMCERINAVSPEFLTKTLPVTLAAT